MAHMHFLQVCPLIYQALTYLRSHNKFYENMHNIIQGTMTARTVKNNLNGTIGKFFLSGNTFSFLPSVKERPG